MNLEEENKKLKEQNKILIEKVKNLQYAQEFVDWSSVFRCKHCHHYSLQGYICHHCGKDPSVKEK